MDNKILFLISLPYWLDCDEKEYIIIFLKRKNNKNSHKDKTK